MQRPGIWELADIMFLHKKKSGNSITIMIIFQETSKLEGFAVGMWVGRYVGRGFALVAWWRVAGLVYMLVGLSPEMSFVGTCCYRTDAILATMVAVHAVFVRLEHVHVIVWTGTVPVIVKVVGGCTVFPP